MLVCVCVLNTQECLMNNEPQRCARTLSLCECALTPYIPYTKRYVRTNLQIFGQLQIACWCIGHTHTHIFTLPLVRAAPRLGMRLMRTVSIVVNALQKRRSCACAFVAVCVLLLFILYIKCVDVCTCQRSASYTKCLRLRSQRAAHMYAYDLLTFRFGMTG